MTVETITQPMSDFAIKLSNALKSIGHHYFGKVDYDKINIEEYLKLSPREMALRYAREHDLETKKKVFDIFKLIYTENQKNNFSLSLREILGEKKLDYILYSMAIVRCGLVRRKGDRIRTEYHWMGSAAPVFSDAEMLCDLVQQMKQYELDKKSAEYIQNHVKDELEDVIKHLNPENSTVKLYEITRVFKMKRSHHNTREKKLKEILEARKVMDREISRKMPEPQVLDQFVDPPVQQQATLSLEAAELKGEVFQPADPPLTGKKQDKASPEEGLLYLMAQRVKMYKKITKIQEKMLRQYEQKLKQ